MKYLNKILNNKITFKEKNNFALIIGLTPSKGARSPALWNSAYKFFNKKTKMFPADVKEKNLGKLCNYLKSNRYFLGSSVTVPYKEKIMKYLDHIDENAKSIGSINTIVNKNGKLFGLNTDYSGSIYTLKKIKIKRSKQKILVFGCGGAGKACIVSVINYFKNSQIQLFNRNSVKLKTFVKNIKIKNNNTVKTFSNLRNLNRFNNLDCIINCTSVGFDGWVYKDGYYNLKNFSPTSNVNFSKINKPNYQNFIYKNKEKIKINLNNTINFLAKIKFVTIFDIIYQPLKTNLMIAGELLGHKTVNGLEMNFMQAVEAFKIVNNLKNKDKIIKGMRNGK